MIDYRGLDQLSGLTNPTTNGHPGMRNLVGLLSSTPGLPPDFVQGILGQAFGNVTAKQQASAQNYQSGLGSLINYAQQPTATSAGLAGLSNLVGSSLPPGQQAQLSGAQPDLSTLLPSGTGTADSLTPDDQTGIASAIVTQFQAATQAGPVTADTLRGILTSMRQQAIGLGKSPAGVEAAASYAKSVLAQLSGTSPEALDALMNPPAAPPNNTASQLTGSPGASNFAAHGGVRGVPVPGYVP